MAGDRASWLAIVGPTGSGKSELALFIARRLGGEIINCDALQVYQGLDIGTAKVSIQARAQTPHHLLDIVAPDREFSAAEFAGAASEAIREIDRRGRLAVVVGGTGLYLRSLRQGLFEGPGRSKTTRARLRGIGERYGASALHRILSCWDPVSAARIHPNDRVRVVRALEVAFVSKRPMSELMVERKTPLPGFDSVLIGLQPEKESLHRRIDSRVDRMFQQGFVEEVRHLVRRWGYNAPAFKAIGYREVASALRQGSSLDEAKSRCQQATRQYAKRQMTWFRREEEIRWFEGYGDEDRIKLDVVEYLDGIIEGRAPGL